MAPRRKVVSAVQDCQDVPEEPSSSEPEEESEEDEVEAAEGSSDEASEQGADGEGAAVEDEDEAEEEAPSSGRARGARGAQAGPSSGRAGSSGAAAAAGGAGQRGKLTLALKKSGEACKVCGSREHRAGFVGATYHDCPNRPCYLCKLPGHTTATCPYRIAPGHGCSTPVQSSATRGGARSVVAQVLRRECGDSPRPSPPAPVVPRYQVDAAILKIHSRRCTTLEFHPRNDSIVVSGDKKGQIAIWNYDQVHERTTYDMVHCALLNGIRFAPWLGGDGVNAVTASSDGTAKVVDLETGSFRPLMDLNPGGWVRGAPWYMFYGCDVLDSLHCVVVGDSEGFCHVLDPRTSSGGVAKLQLHKKGSKVVGVNAHPLMDCLVLSAGNDHTARIFDIRALGAHFGDTHPQQGRPVVSTAAEPAGADASLGGEGGPSTFSATLPSPGAPSSTAGRRGGAAGGGSSGSGKGGSAGGAGGRAKRGKQSEAKAGAYCSAELACMQHPRVVNSAAFSPHTGRRVLTTCQDNRLRVWDYAPCRCDNTSPDREVVHSHDFNRYLTPFRAEWDAKDAREEVMVIGRYISEEYGGVALHPVDIISAASGALLAALTDSHLTTISPVNKPHPRRDLIVSGSSRSLYLWAPAEDDAEEQEQRQRAPVDTASGVAALLQRASKKYVYYDADPGGTSGKKRGKPGKGAQDDDDDDD